MTLVQYYHAEDANKSNIYAPEELAGLRASIKEFFDGFDEAVKQDCEAEGRPLASAFLLNDAYITKAYLTKNRDALLGLGQYLLDFRGFNDEILKEANFNFIGLTHIVFTYEYAFNEAHFRLLELSERRHYATLLPYKDNVAEFILTHLDEFNENELKVIFNELKEMKKKVEKNGFKLEDYTTPYLLYKVINRRLSVFNKW
ncbi:MAG: hypothetical protein IJ019_02025 [Alphaproteobacteria bacterium]|nr:hypothetical protein [Alphaproteobacteria bacterium]